MYDGEADARISSTVRAKKGVSRRFLTLGQKLANADLRVRRNNERILERQRLHTRF